MAAASETALQPHYILGISAFYGSSAAALLRDGKIIAAAQEERFTRIRRDASFPTSAINWCLNAADITLNDVAYVTFYDKPLINFGRLLETYKAIVPGGFKSFIATTTGWLSEKLFQKRLLVKELSRITPNFPSSKLLFAQHNLSHAAGAFYPSPHEKAVVLVLDGIGEWTTTTVAIGTPDNLEIIREINFPHSLGLLYSAFTSYIGYRTGGGEYTLMHLALHGQPVYADLIRRHIIHVKPDGSYRLNSDYFNFTSGASVTNSRFDKLFGGPSRKPGTEPTQREMDLAASIQLVTEEIILRITRSLADEFPDIPNLCLAGELALNSSINTKILRDGSFKNVWIQPAASDSGGAVGAAFCAWHQHMGMPLSAKPSHGHDLMHGAFLGPAYTSEAVAEVFDRIGAIYRPIKAEQEILDRTVDALSEGKIIGWFQGPAEFGTRALGARSILGDPRNPQTHNLALKSRFRQSYRPLAASVAKENAEQWFDNQNSPYMLFTSHIQKKLLKRMTPRQQALNATEKLDVVRGSLPAITNVDYTTRLQTVHAETNRRFHALLKEFEHKTGFPILANTAFCSNNEPLVNTPEDAFHCFMSTDLDVMVIENHVLYKEEQNPALFPAYRTKLSRA